MKMNYKQPAQELYNKKKYEKCCQTQYNHTFQAKFLIWTLNILSFSLSGISFYLFILSDNGVTTLPIIAIATIIGGVIYNYKNTTQLQVSSLAIFINTSITFFYLFDFSVAIGAIIAMIITIIITFVCMVIGMVLDDCFDIQYNKRRIQKK